jgi:hypothetical protein
MWTARPARPQRSDSPGRQYRSVMRRAIPMPHVDVEGQAMRRRLNASMRGALWSLYKVSRVEGRNTSTNSNVFRGAYPRLRNIRRTHTTRWCATARRSLRSTTSGREPTATGRRGLNNDCSALRRRRVDGDGVLEPLWQLSLQGSRTCRLAPGHPHPAARAADRLTSSAWPTNDFSILHNH